jgi:hypothetical protein
MLTLQLRNGQLDAGAFRTDWYGVLFVAQMIGVFFALTPCAHLAMRSPAPPR